MLLINFYFVVFQQKLKEKERKKAHPLKVEEVLFEGFSGLSLLALVDYIRVFFVATALIVLAAVGLPVTETHPAEVYRKSKIHI